MPNQESKALNHGLTTATASQIEEVQKHAYNSDKEKPFALYSSLPYYTMILIYGMTYICLAKLHNGWLMVFIEFAGIPLLDKALPQDWLNPNKKQTKELSHDIFFKIPLFLTSLVDWAFFFWFIDHLSQQPFDLMYWSGACIISGVNLATNFLVAHELFHKHKTLDRIVGGLTMVKMLYTHFFIEHQYGHHKHIGTLHDPATSRFGESFYSYLSRVIVDSWKSAWNIEKRRMISIKGYKTHWHVENLMIWYAIGIITFPIFIYSIYGLTGMYISLVLAAISIVVLECTDYLEHYGLRRKEIAPGEYEPVNITHSWNAPHRLSNYILFKLQRHSDHHENSFKPYQSLASYDESPMLPSGYAFCITLCLSPFFWFKIMDPITIAYNKGVKLTTQENAAVQKWINIFLGLVILILGTMAILGQQ